MLASKAHIDVYSTFPLKVVELVCFLPFHVHLMKLHILSQKVYFWKASFAVSIDDVINITWITVLKQEMECYWTSSVIHTRKSLRVGIRKYQHSWPIKSGYNSAHLVWKKRLHIWSWEHNNHSEVRRWGASGYGMGLLFCRGVLEYTQAWKSEWSDDLGLIRGKFNRRRLHASTRQQAQIYSQNN